MKKELKPTLKGSKSYSLVLGYWRGAKRAKDAQTGKFVSLSRV